MAAHEVVIIGSGPGGYVAAIRASQLGADVVVVEERELGGVCLNRGCIPTKAILESARVLSHLKSASKLGLKTGDVEVDYAAIVARKNAVTARLGKGVASLFKKGNIEVVSGRGRLIDVNTVEVTGDAGSTRVEGKTIIIATGSEPASVSSFPMDHPRVINSDDALELSELPESVLVIGGGYIGCEFASMWAEFGSAVTVVEMLPTLLPVADADVSKEMMRALKRKRAKVHVGAKIEKLSADDDKVTAELSDGKVIEAQLALVAVGRKLNSDLDGLAELGVALDDRAITVDAFGCTNVEGIRAIGDVTGRWLLAHYASEQGVCAVEHLLGADAKPLDENAVPSCVFTIPEIASVGLTEAAAREKFGDAIVGRFDLAALGKAQASGDTTGFVKVISDPERIVVGVHMVGHEVTTMIAEAALAVRMRMKIDEVVHTIHAHPTMPEAFHEAALDLLGRAIHKL